MVAAMLGGSAPIIQAGAIAALTANAAGGDVVIVGATGTVSPFRLMARPEIKQPADLKGKKAGITTFGSTSDQVVRIALKQFGLEPNKDVALLTFGAQPEVFAALQHNAIQAAPLSYPLYPKATKMGMRELVNFADLGVEDINGTRSPPEHSSPNNAIRRCVSCAPLPAACTAIEPIKNSAKRF